ncbi:MAG: hypothetical protein KGY60_12625 [Bacteroidales bacterium]|nr:hypothetical protein [Bacteroidales bacterium]
MRAIPDTGRFGFTWAMFCWPYALVILLTRIQHESKEEQKIILERTIGVRL